jgi:hypothetical protein
MRADPGALGRRTAVRGPRGGRARPPRDPGCIQKFEGCLALTLRARGSSPSFPAPRKRPPRFPALAARFASPRDSRDGPPRWVQGVEKKSKVVEGAASGLGDAGWEEVGRWLCGPVGSLPRGRRSGDTQYEPPELRSPAASPFALRRVGAAGAAQTAAAGRRRRSDPGSRGPQPGRRFATGGFRGRCDRRGVPDKPGRHKVKGGAIVSPAAGGRRKCPSNLCFSVMQTT